MANKITDTFSNLFKTTKDQARDILKKQAKSATSDITSKASNITSKAKSVFDESSGKSSSFLDKFKNKLNIPDFNLPTTSKASKPIATSGGNVKFVPGETRKAAKSGKKGGVGKLFKSKKGLLIAGIGMVAGMVFLVKPKRRK